MSLNGVIDTFAQGTYAFTRGSAGAYVSGRWVAGATSVVNIEGCVQPVTGSELQALPEGFHAENTRKFYTKTQVFGITEGATGTGTDRVTIGADEWGVYSVEHWTRSLSGGAYYKALLKKVVP